jgi:hypothetical protein
MIEGMSENDPQFDIVSDVLFERRSDSCLFQVASNGAVSYYSADGQLGWRSLAPAAAIETNLLRGQLAECKADGQLPEVTLTFRYPRLPVRETMTIRLLEDPAATTIERVLHNAGTVPLPVQEVRMLAVDGGGLLFGDTSPADLRCVHTGNIRQPVASPAGPQITPLPQTTRVFADPGGNGPAALAVGNADMTAFLLEASLTQAIFSQAWQIQARKDWRPGWPIVADYAAIARDVRRQPLVLAPGQKQGVWSLFYQVRTQSSLQALYEDILANLP